MELWQLTRRAVIYCIGNASLNALNWLWFYKMVMKMLARLSGGDKPASKLKSKVRRLPNETQPLLEADVVSSEAEDGDADKEKSRDYNETLSLPADPPSPVASSKRPSEGW